MKTPQENYRFYESLGGVLIVLVVLVTATIYGVTRDVAQARQEKFLRYEGRQVSTWYALWNTPELPADQRGNSVDH
jgi:hypothetical protein